MKRTGFAKPEWRPNPAGAERVQQEGGAKKRYSTLKPSSSPLKRSRGLALRSAERIAEDDPEDGLWTLLRAERFAIDTDPATGLVVCQAVGLLPGSCYGMIVAHHLDEVGKGYPRICAVDRLRSVCAIGHHTGWPNGIHVDTARARRVGLLR